MAQARSSTHLAKKPKEVSRKPGRPRDPELEARRRAEILAVAALVFARTGYTETDVQIVADQVGVGKGTIYRYFPTKKELFLAAVDQGLNELDALINAVLEDAATPPLVRFKLALQTYLQFFANRPEMIELFIQERAVFRDRHKPLYFSFKESEPCETTDRFVQTMIDQGLLRPLQMDHLHEVIRDLLYGTVMTNSFTKRASDPAEQAQKILDILLFGILSDRERRRSQGRKASS